MINSEIEAKVSQMSITDAVIYLDTVKRDDDYPKNYKSDVETIVYEKIAKDLAWS